MDELDRLLDSFEEDGTFTEATGVNSETKSAEEKDPQPASASVSGGENKSIESTARGNVNEEVSGDGAGDGNEDYSEGVSDAENADDSQKAGDGDSSVPETEGRQPRNGGHKGGHGKGKKGFSRLDSAEWKAEKWKTKAKEAIAARNALAEEFEKYRNLNPRAFDNDEDRMEYLAWRASTAQRLNDMDSDIDAMADESEREAFSAKVAQCYNEEGAAQFERLDSHYRDALSWMCMRADPDNVIVDFLSGSKYEAPMREVIYKNGKLQDELFRKFNNPAIAASERLAVLKELERQVRDFYTRPRNGSGQGARVNVSNNVPRQPQTQNHNQNQGQPMQTGARFTLPSMRNGQQANAGVQRAGSVNNMARKASGSLTRGSEPTSNMDVSSQADALFRELLKSGM